MWENSVFMHFSELNGSGCSFAELVSDVGRSMKNCDSEFQIKGIMRLILKKACTNITFGAVNEDKLRLCQELG